MVNSEKIQTTIEGEILGVPVSIPVVVEYDYHPTIPGCGTSPRESAHIEIKSFRVTEGLHIAHDAKFLFTYRGDIEDQILNEIRQERESA